MSTNFKIRKFSEIDHDDSFFNPLKNDYPADGTNIGFEEWFKKKGREGAEALVYEDDQGIRAFISLKDENENLILKGIELEKMPRMKISTLLISEDLRGQRLGEGAMGLALWQWQETGQEEIYITVFEKHELLISLLKKFGFNMIGYNLNGECVYLKSRKELVYSDPYKSFPFINPEFENAGYLLVEDRYHDTLFPYSELQGTLQEQRALSVANGLSKIYVGSPRDIPPYVINEPILVYRKYNGKGSKGHRSCITSYCIVKDLIIVKGYGSVTVPFNKFLNLVGNKTVFSEKELKEMYDNNKNLIVVEMLYYGFFGAGNNINWWWLKNNGYWPEGYPTNELLSNEEFKVLLEEGKVDVSNVIID